MESFKTSKIKFRLSNGKYWDKCGVSAFKFLGNIVVAIYQFLGDKVLTQPHLFLSFEC